MAQPGPFPQRVSILKVLVGIALSMCFLPAGADSGVGQWSTRLPIYLSATMRYGDSIDSHNRLAMLAGMLELQFQHGCRPWTAGPFLDVRLTSDRQTRKILSSGAIFRHMGGRWDTTALLFRQMPSNDSATWSYAARLRYRITPTSKLGAEAFGSIEHPESTRLMIGYYADVSDSVSFQLVADTKIGRQSSRAARMDLVWQIN